MPRNDKYIAPFCVGGAGLLCLASPLFLNLGTQMPEYMASKEVSARHEQERMELVERKKTNDQIRKTGLPINSSTFTIFDYLYDPKQRPKLSQGVLNRYQTKQAIVYDAADKCIGRIIKAQLILIHDSPKVCEVIK